MADAPATPQTPPAAPTPAPAAPPSTSAPSQGASSPFSALDTKAKTLPAKESKAPSTPAPDPNKAPDPATPQTPPDKTQVESPKALREAVKARTQEKEAAERKARDLEAKIADYEKRGLDTTALNDSLTKKEEELGRLRGEIASIRYEKSDEFKKKYDEPFTGAASYAKSIVENLLVKDEADADPRKATWDDFISIYQLPPVKAEQAARAMFGDTSNLVMRQYEKLRELDSQRQNAVKEYHANSAEREKQTRADNATKADKINRAWAAINKDLTDANPGVFGENPEDEEGNSIFKESLALVDQAYTGRDKLTPDEQIVLDAHIRLRAAAYPRLIREMELLKSKLEEYEGGAEERKKSTPGKTKTAGAPAEVKDKDWKSDLREALA